MTMTLNPRSPIPLYHQLAEILSGQIRQGVYRVGEKIPAETLLARDYALGRPTVRQAIDQLVRKGMVQRRRGSGTYVLPVHGEVGLFSLAGTTSAFQEQGIEPQIRILDAVREEKPVDSDNPFVGTSVYRVVRLISVDSGPVLIEVTYLSKQLFPGLEKVDLQGQSLAQIVAEHYYLHPLGGRQSFQVQPVGDDYADLLGLKCATPILYVRRRLHFHDMDDGIYSRLYCRTDKFVFTQNLHP